jgi:5-methylcytosine-specific restriction protein A
MPVILRPCLSCHALYHPTGSARCPTCTVTYERNRQRALDAVRGSPSQRGYGSDWQRVRLEVLERDGHACHWCGRPATQADHLVPLARGGARLDPSNVVASCGHCNATRGGVDRWR